MFRFFCTNVKFILLLFYIKEIYNEVVLRPELAKKSIWVIKNHGSNQKNKNNALELKKRLEQLNKQLKVNNFIFLYINLCIL